MLRALCIILTPVEEDLSGSYTSSRCPPLRVLSPEVITSSCWEIQSCKKTFPSLSITNRCVSIVLDGSLFYFIAVKFEEIICNLYCISIGIDNIYGWLGRLVTVLNRWCYSMVFPSILKSVPGNEHPSSLDRSHPHNTTGTPRPHLHVHDCVSHAASATYFLENTSQWAAMLFQDA